MFHDILVSLRPNLLLSLWLFYCPSYTLCSSHTEILLFPLKYQSSLIAPNLCILIPSAAKITLPPISAWLAPTQVHTPSETSFSQALCSYSSLYTPHKAAVPFYTDNSSLLAQQYGTVKMNMQGAMVQINLGNR